MKPLTWDGSQPIKKTNAVAINDILYAPDLKVALERLDFWLEAVEIRSRS